MEGYRLLVRRLQGEASVLAGGDEAAVAVPEPGRPERFLVRKLDRQLLLAASEVEWLQAGGNYVNMRGRGRHNPLRTPLASVEPQLNTRRLASTPPPPIPPTTKLPSTSPLATPEPPAHLKPLPP